MNKFLYKLIMVGLCLELWKAVGISALGNTCAWLTIQSLFNTWKWNNYFRAVDAIVFMFSCALWCSQCICGVKVFIMFCMNLQ